jgi:hypothetical protein
MNKPNQKNCLIFRYDSETRQFVCSVISERRSGKDRRNGNDRRKGMETESE